MPPALFLFLIGQRPGLPSKGVQEGLHFFLGRDGTNAVEILVRPGFPAARKGLVGTDSQMDAIMPCAVAGTGRIRNHNIARFLVVVPGPGHDFFEMLVRKMIAYSYPRKGLMGIRNGRLWQDFHGKFHILHQNAASVGRPMIGELHRWFRFYAVELLNEVGSGAARGQMGQDQNLPEPGG